MNKFLKYVAAVALLFIGLGAFAQEKSRAYYDTHESEILPDAQAAFKNGDYDRTVELCRLHYAIVGDNRADALRDIARECVKLAIEMNALASAGQRELAREKAQAILALNPDDKRAQELSVNPTKGTINGHEWVDLGLPSGLKWATCNVGATSPSEYGSYFAWGETKPKSDYSWSTLRYHYLDSWSDRFSKYNTKSAYAYGTVDNKTRLDLSDDAARANWGGSWRMPTRAEQDELCEKCTWTWTTQGGKNGYKVTSKTNGNSIFFPAAGVRIGARLSDAGSYGRYMSSSLYSDDPFCAYYLSFRSGGVGYYHFSRYGGSPVRPVSK